MVCHVVKNLRMRDLRAAAPDHGGTVSQLGKCPECSQGCGDDAVLPAALEELIVDVEP